MERQLSIGSMGNHFKNNTVALRQRIKSGCEGLRGSIKSGKMKDAIQSAKEKLDAKAGYSYDMDSQQQKIAKRSYLENPGAFINNAKSDALEMVDKKESGLFGEVGKIRKSLGKYKIAGFVVGAIATVSAVAGALIAFRVSGITEIILQGKLDWVGNVFLGVAAVGAAISWATFREGHRVAIKGITQMGNTLGTAINELEENVSTSITEIRETWSARL